MGTSFTQFVGAPPPFPAQWPMGDSYASCLAFPRKLTSRLIGLKLNHIICWLRGLIRIRWLRDSHSHDDTQSQSATPSKPKKQTNNNNKRKYYYTWIDDDDDMELLEHHLQTKLGEISHGGGKNRVWIDKGVGVEPPSTFQLESCMGTRIHPHSRPHTMFRPH